MNLKQRQEIRELLLRAYNQDGLWGIVNPAWPIPQGVQRGTDIHLTYLTLVYAVSGGRDPIQLWQSAQQTFAENPHLFSPSYLAHAKPKDLSDALRQHQFIQKPKSEAVTWQRIGQALMMRANGSVQQLLAGHEYDALAMMTMLAQNKTTFPVLSGAQTAPRWLYGLFSVGEQPLKGIDQLSVPSSPNAKRVLDALQISATKLSVGVFDAVDMQGRQGCRQRKKTEKRCPVADNCPLVRYCLYGS